MVDSVRDADLGRHWLEMEKRITPFLGGASGFGVSPMRFSSRRRSDLSMLAFASTGEPFSKPPVVSFYKTL